MFYYVPSREGRRSFCFGISLFSCVKATIRSVAKFRSKLAFALTPVCETSLPRDRYPYAVISRQWRLDDSTITIRFVFAERRQPTARWHQYCWWIEPLTVPETYIHFRLYCCPQTDSWIVRQKINVYGRVRVRFILGVTKCCTEALVEVKIPHRKYYIPLYT